MKIYILSGPESERYEWTFAENVYQLTWASVFWAEMNIQIKYTLAQLFCNYNFEGEFYVKYGHNVWIDG